MGRKNRFSALKMKIYTKTGDQGQTSLVGGRRVSKADAQVEAYGELDELNAWLGLVASDLLQLQEAGLHGEVLHVQDCLFRIGGFYAFDFQSGEPFSLPFIGKADTDRLEAAIDRMEAGLPGLKAFILPGGSLSACHAHIARTVCRRCERALLRFSSFPQREREKEIEARAYVNRLSDFLFVLARHENRVCRTEEQVFGLQAD